MWPTRKPTLEKNKTTRSIRWQLTKKEAIRARLVNTTQLLRNHEGKDTQMTDRRVVVNIISLWIKGCYQS